MSHETIVNPVVRENEDDHARAFADAQPFRHVVIDDFFDRAYVDQLLQEFPAFERGNFIGDDGHAGGKSTVDAMARLGPAYRRLDEVIQKPAFLDYIGRITGIEGLLYDPFYLGGGTHENRDGQPLSAHIDFNYHPSERWHRRLNLIVYLNHEWEERWGGLLDLYRDPYADPEPAKSIVPLFNRCVIFETTEHSWHGFRQICLPPDRPGLSRKSIALYFYTKDRAAEETAGRHTTHYVNRQLPAHFAAGHTLTAADVSTLHDLIGARDGQMKMLYEENSRLLQAQDKGFAGHVLYLLKRLYMRYRRHTAHR
ncbi:2OG-Fe(II) oxygenase [Luteibacter yeojuensis]|uniref:2OG-Fe(II) oxygenase n=1 Tax=Luteibacter yeojuensis TaxID=345309 RepID=UPI00308433CC